MALHTYKILQIHFDVSVQNYVVHQLEDVFPKLLQDWGIAHLRIWRQHLVKIKPNVAIPRDKLDNAFLRMFVAIPKVENSLIFEHKEYPLKISCFSGQCARDETCTDSSNVRQILQDLELTLEEMIERENTDIEYWKEVKLDTKKKDYWKTL